MVQEHLQLNLEAELIYHQMWLYHVLGDFLDSINRSSGLMESLIDSPEFSLTQQLAKYKVLDLSIEEWGGFGFFRT